MKEFRVKFKAPTQIEIRQAEMLIISIMEEEVREKDFKRLDFFIASLREAGIYARSKNIISFEYDNDDRELFMIPEVRVYVKEIFKRYPEILYYIDLGEHHVFVGLLLHFFKIQQVKNKIGGVQVGFYLDDEGERQVKEAVVGIFEYAEKIGDEDKMALFEIFEVAENLLEGNY